MLPHIEECVECFLTFLTSPDLCTSQTNKLKFCSQSLWNVYYAHQRVANSSSDKSKSNSDAQTLLILREFHWKKTTHLIWNEFHWKKTRSWWNFPERKLLTWSWWNSTERKIGTLSTGLRHPSSLEEGVRERCSECEKNTSSDRKLLSLEGISTNIKLNLRCLIKLSSLYIRYRRTSNSDKRTNPKGNKC